MLRMQNRPSFPPLLLTFSSNDNMTIQESDEDEKGQGAITKTLAVKDVELGAEEHDSCKDENLGPFVRDQQSLVVARPSSVDSEWVGLLSQVSNMEGQLRISSSVSDSRFKTVETKLQKTEAKLQDTEKELREARQKLILLEQASNLYDNDLPHSLPQDTFIFLVTSPVRSLPFAFSLAIYGFQMVTFVLVILNLLDQGSGSNNPFGIPGNVLAELRAAQFIAMLIAVLTQDDIVTAAVLFRDGYNVNYIQKLPYASPRKFWLSVFARFSEGCLGLVVSFLLIVTATTVVELLLNFTAIAFVSNLDDVMFFLAKQGFTGRRCKRQARSIAEARFKPEKHGRIPKVLMLAVIVCVLIISWVAVIHSQVTGDFFCKTLYVQFGDDFRPDLGAFSGLYDRQTKPYSLFSERRVVYVERRFLDLAGRQRRARFAYCSTSSTWAFHWDDSAGGGIDADPCQYVARSEQTDTFDLLTTASGAWFVQDGNKREVVLTPLYLTCMDCDDKKEDACNGRGYCSSGECTCSKGFHGSRCEFLEPCRELVVDIQTSPFSSSRQWPRNYKLLYGDGGTIAQAYNRSVYISTSETGGYDVIVFLGRRWGLTSSTDLPTNVTNHEELAKFFEEEYHAHSPGLKFSFLSEPTDVGTPKDSFLPEQLQWVQASRPIISEFGVSSQGPGADTNTLLLCLHCNEITNPCQYDGVCVNETCQCASAQPGSLGNLCQVPPSGNGLCNRHFNTLEFAMDGGDCCEQTCSSSAEFHCGYDASGSYFIGYPYCKEEGNKWYENEVAGSFLSGLGSYVALDKGGSVLAIAQAGDNRIRLFDKDGLNWTERRAEIVLEQSALTIESISIVTGAATQFSRSTFVVPVFIAIEIIVITMDIQVKFFLCDIEGCQEIGPDLENATKVSVLSDGSRVAVAKDAEVERNYYDPDCQCQKSAPKYPAQIEIYRRSILWDEGSLKYKIDYDTLEEKVLFPTTYNLKIKAMTLASGGDHLMVQFEQDSYTTNYTTYPYQRVGEVNSMIVSMRRHDGKKFAPAGNTIYEVSTNISSSSNDKDWEEQVNIAEKPSFVVSDDGHSVFVNSHSCIHTFFEWNERKWKEDISPFKDVACRVHALSHSATTSVIEDKNGVLSTHIWNGTVGTYFDIPGIRSQAIGSVALSPNGRVLAIGMPDEANNAGLTSTFLWVPVVDSGSQKQLRVSITPYTEKTSWILYSNASGDVKMEGSSQDLPALAAFTNDTFVASEECLVFTLYPWDLHCIMNPQKSNPNGVCNASLSQGRFDLLMGKDYITGASFGAVEEQFVYQPNDLCGAKAYPPVRRLVGNCEKCSPPNRFYFAIKECHQTEWALFDDDGNLVVSSATGNRCGQGRTSTRNCVKWTTACVDAANTCYSLSLSVAASEGAYLKHHVQPFYAFVDETIVASSLIDLAPFSYTRRFHFGKCQSKIDTNSPTFPRNWTVPTTAPTVSTTAPTTATFAPTRAPTHSPSISLAPSQAPQPTSSVAPTIDYCEAFNCVVVRSTLSYRLAAFTNPREPTQQEIDGLLVETARFYNSTFAAQLFNYVKYKAEFIGAEFNPGQNDFPISITFMAHILFSFSTPSFADVTSVMEQADYEGDYIPNFIRNSWSVGTVLIYTEEVAYSFLLTASPTTTPSVAPTKSWAPSTKPSMSQEPSISPAPTVEPTLSHIPSLVPTDSPTPARTEAPVTPPLVPMRGPPALTTTNILVFLPIGSTDSPSTVPSGVPSDSPSSSLVPSVVPSPDPTNAATIAWSGY